MRSRRPARFALIALFALAALFALGDGSVRSIADGTSNTGRLAGAFLLPYIEQENVLPYIEQDNLRSGR